jgi:hypothetical protein
MSFCPFERRPGLPGRKISASIDAGLFSPVLHIELTTDLISLPSSLSQSRNNVLAAITAAKRTATAAQILFIVRISEGNHTQAILTKHLF